jgi:HSP20 family molecular chaperone IbpA
VRWELPGPRFPSAESIVSRFDELIHQRWEAALSRLEAGEIFFQEDLWLELDLPGVEKSELRVRLELRREGGRLRARVRRSEPK